jgi:hypothetical protein
MLFAGYQKPTRFGAKPITSAYKIDIASAVNKTFIR